VVLTDPKHLQLRLIITLNLSCAIVKKLLFHSLDLFPDSSNLFPVLKTVDFLNSAGLSCAGSFQESDSIYTCPNPRSTAGDSDGFTEWHLRGSGSFTPLQTSKQTGIGLGIPALNLAESLGEELFKELGVADIKAARALSAEDIQIRV